MFAEFAPVFLCAVNQFSNCGEAVRARYVSFGSSVPDVQRQPEMRDALHLIEPALKRATCAFGFPCLFRSLRQITCYVSVEP